MCGKMFSREARKRVSETDGAAVYLSCQAYHCKENMNGITAVNFKLNKLNSRQIFPE